jgi:hypothetical protein
LFDDDLCFSQRIEDFLVEEFVPEPSVEALYIAVLPRRAWHNVGGLCSNRADPVAYGFGNAVLKNSFGQNRTFHAPTFTGSGSDQFNRGA